MRKIMIAAHGYLAKGMKHTLNLLVGEVCPIEVINAYVDDSDYTIEIEQFLKAAESEDEVYIFTDLYGGSVNQKVTALKLKFDFTLITGFNLAVLVAVALASEPLSREQLNAVIAESREALQVVEPEYSEQQSDEEFF